MKFVICKAGETQLGKTTVALERGQMTLVFKQVPAEICADCGEAYVDDDVTRQMLETAEAAACAGVQVDVREFAPDPA